MRLQITQEPGKLQPDQGRSLSFINNYPTMMQLILAAIGPLVRSLCFSVLILALGAGCTISSDNKTEEVVEVPSIPVEEYKSRRAQLLRTLSDGILLVHARSSEKTMEQWGFIQDPTFFYLSGLAEVPGAILALDGPAGTSHLFLPPAPEMFGMKAEGIIPETGSATANLYEFDSAQPWDAFVPWLEGRIHSGTTRLYVDEARRPEAPGVPDGLTPVSGERLLWRNTLRSAFPSAELVSAKRVIMEQKAVKSKAEINILTRNAKTTVISLDAVAQRLEAGVRQRDTEAAMIEACLSAGGEGPSFWPWTMSGPNAHFGHLVGAFFRYDQGDRRAQPGELVRVDIGCAGGFYGADVGRTLPVSGQFTDGQAEAWDLLIKGYLAGLDAMADGVSVSSVRAASIEAVEGAQKSMVTEEGMAAAVAILAGGESTWHIHGVGIESGEDIPDVLRTGMVLAYEPGFFVAENAYYLEDMILITDTGHTILSKGLPYTSEQIAEAMK